MDQSSTRKLTAIMLGDIAVFTALSVENEEKHLELIEKQRELLLSIVVYRLLIGAFGHQQNKKYSPLLQTLTKHTVSNIVTVPIICIIMIHTYKINPIG